MVDRKQAPERGGWSTESRHPRPSLHHRSMGRALSSTHRPTHRDARTRAGDIATRRDVRLRIDRIDETTTTTTVVIGDDGRHDDGDGSVCVFRGDAVFNGNDDDDDDDDDDV